LIVEGFDKYVEVFLEKNSRLNLISKNDEKFLREKHIYDSLAIEKFFKLSTFNYQPSTLLDIGTGGGFPAIPIAIEYPGIEVYALDSIRKKINAIEEIKAELGLNNLHPICERAENLIICPPCKGGAAQRRGDFDIITSRAVAPLKTITGYAMPLLKKGGYFIAYKSRKVREEIDEAKPVLKKFNAKVIDIIEYELALKENHTRNLVIIKNY
jgi:16S rRNA (guanine527-N7)-methyltransferase